MSTMIARVLSATSCIVAAAWIALAAVPTAGAEPVLHCEECHENVHGSGGEMTIWHDFEGNQECNVGTDCRRCGGTSDCHIGEEQGYCHVPCNGCCQLANTEKEAMELALTSTNADKIVTALRHSKYSYYNASRQSIQIRSGCNQDVLAANLPVERELAQQVEERLRVAAADLE